LIVSIRSLIDSYFFFTVGTLLAAATSRARFFDTLVFHQALVFALLGFVLAAHAVVALWRIGSGAAWDENGEFSWELAIDLGSSGDGDGGDGDGGGGE
jgi:hypothetical protein